MSRSKLPILVALCLGVPGCSFEYRIDARLRGGKLVFEATDKSVLFEPHRCAGSLEVLTANPAASTPTYRTVWRIEAAPESEACADYPIVYGLAPPGLRQTHAPEKLRKGALYEVQAFGSGNGVGSFRIFSVRGRAAIASEG